MAIYLISKISKRSGLVVQGLDNVIQWLNQYPADRMCSNFYPLESDLPSLNNRGLIEKSVLLPFEIFFTSSESNREHNFMMIIFS